MAKYNPIKIAKQMGVDIKGLYKESKELYKSKKTEDKLYGELGKKRYQQETGRKMKNTKANVDEYAKRKRQAKEEIAKKWQLQSMGRSVIKRTIPISK